MPIEAWEAASHEAVDRRTNIGTIFWLAWQLWNALPDARRERLLRKLEELESKEAK